MKLKQESRNPFPKLTKAALTVAFLLAAPVVAGCESASDQVNQQVDQLQDQAGEAAIDKLNEVTRGELEARKNEALRKLEQARKKANKAVREAQQRASQARENAGQAGS